MVGGYRRPVAHQHDRLDAGDLPDQWLEEWEERLIDEEDLVLSILDDEFQVLWEQTQVERMQDGAHAGHGVVQLKVSVVVPRQRGHAIAGFDAESLEGAGEAIDAADHLAIGRPVIPLFLFGDHLSLLVQPLQSPENVLHRELVVLHQAFHGRTSSKSSHGMTSLRGGW